MIAFTTNSLVPELSVSNFSKSLDFYTRILGFTTDYMRKEDGFAYLSLGNAHIMIDEIGRGRTWKTAELEHPLGRGVNFEIEVESIQPILTNLKQDSIELFLDVEEKWYRKDDRELGNKQFLVMDPDGYLLRFTEDLGSRFLA
jgi:catechol 2,3-dioxygenase-like lactoylglutathione lyase family enzyme